MILWVKLQEADGMGTLFTWGSLRTFVWFIRDKTQPHTAKKPWTIVQNTVILKDEAFGQ